MGRINRKAAAVILFIDTVTQRPITGRRLLVKIRQKSPMIWKEDGYLVILEQPGVDELDISVSGDRFMNAGLHIDIRSQNTVQVRYVQLLPSVSYPFTQRMAVIHVSIHADETAQTVYALRTQDSSKYKLMEDIASGEKVIKLWGAEGLLPGQMLFLHGADCSEQITLLEPDEDTEYGYHINENVKGSYSKEKTKVYSAIGTTVDESGEYLIAYDGLHKGGEKILLTDGKKNDKEIEIKEGQEYTVQYTLARHAGV